MNPGLLGKKLTSVHLNCDQTQHTELHFDAYHLHYGTSNHLSYDTTRDMVLS
jgi:hypothetical protein